MANLDREPLAIGTGGASCSLVIRRDPLCRHLTRLDRLAARRRAAEQSVRLAGSVGPLDA